MTQPVVYMIAGPNGAGKTTLAIETMPDFSVYEFVNADEIARGMNPLNPEGQAILAGRLMLQRIDDLIAARKSFSFETTGASHGFAHKIKHAKAAGYEFKLFYVWLPNATAAKDRVKLRVSQGGHNIPEATIERRYERSVGNLVKLYLPMADEANIYNGSAARRSKNRAIAVKSAGNFIVYRPDLWHNIKVLRESRRAVMQPSEFLWPESFAAIDAATMAAIRKARQTGTNLLIWENDKMTEITPDQAEAQLREDEKNETL